jgi:hypothetical protein
MVEREKQSKGKGREGEEGRSGLTRAGTRCNKTSADGLSRVLADCMSPFSRTLCTRIHIGILGLGQLRLWADKITAE